MGLEGGGPAGRGSGPAQREGPALTAGLNSLTLLVDGVVAKKAHHSVYVVYLRNPKGDGRAGYYVGMTGLAPEERFANHKAGVKAARIVQRCGVRLVPKLYAHLNLMTYREALKMETRLAEELRERGFQVFGGH